jgi:hypothetical protein
MKSSLWLMRCGPFWPAIASVKFSGLEFA